MAHSSPTGRYRIRLHHGVSLRSGRGAQRGGGDPNGILRSAWRLPRWHGPCTGMARRCSESELGAHNSPLKALPSPSRLIRDPKRAGSSRCAPLGNAVNYCSGAPTNQQMGQPPKTEKIESNKPNKLQLWHTSMTLAAHATDATLDSAASGL